MKLAKSDRRTHMSEDTLPNCLTIKLEGPKIHNIEPVPVINYWFNLVPHRPGTGK